MKFFDCHSHWATEKGHIFRTPEELARQEKIWRTKGRYWSEEEMIETMRANQARVILDLAWTRNLPIAEIRSYHDYAFEVTRRNRDVIFGHWLLFDPRRQAESLDEYRRARDADAGFIGFSVSGSSTGVPPSDPLWFPFYELAIETRAPVIMMVGLTGIGQGTRGGYGMILDHNHPRHVDFVAARYPELDILAARPAYPWQDEMIAVLLHKANVTYELHGWGPRRLPDTLVKEIATRLQDRVMIGCDFPVLEYPKVSADWASLGLTEDVLQKVMYRNAERYFGAR
ncbi:MAG: amidohydrolase family protein [Burkholderiales bacterium]|nr:amidohydrolase family protein [Burkholderiales bacterium]